MRKIALALILFQLIGCAKQPVVTTRPEKKQEEETPQDDTPQAPKTNYMKIGAYIVGTILVVILASVGLIVYCCTRKGKESVALTPEQVQAKKIAEEIAKQDKQDIDRIVPVSVREIRNNYPAIDGFLLKTHTNHPEYKGKVELEAILRWHFLKSGPEGTVDIRPGETNLSYERKYVQTELDKEVTQAREEAESSISTLLTNIESSNWCLIALTKSNMTRYHQAAQGGTLGVLTAPYVMNNIARIVYYYEFKDALIGSEK